MGKVWCRYIRFPVGDLYVYWFCNAISRSGIISYLTISFHLLQVQLIMWLGEQINEYGIEMVFH